jgi:hypothetical protein
MTILFLDIAMSESLPYFSMNAKKWAMKGGTLPKSILWRLVG